MVWRHHLSSVRRAVAKHMGFSTFAEAFVQMLSEKLEYSMCGLIATYLWHEHRDEYSWHFEQRPPGLVWKHKRHRLLPVRESANQPAIRVAQDLRYCSKYDQSPCSYDQLVMEGFCHSSGHKRSSCSSYKPFGHDMLQYQNQLGPSWPVHKAAGAATGIGLVHDHYEKVNKLQYKWPPAALQVIQAIEDKPDHSRLCDACACKRCRFAQNARMVHHTTGPRVAHVEPPASTSRSWAMGAATGAAVMLLLVGWLAAEQCNVKSKIHRA